uniref:Uncharacterized protein n=1 Tax=Myoviridae sp. ctQYc56 TaxID=2825100 RepID=A0A8S5Q0Y6_9CAUD|nr:MAG TPA: hypothetical protein [Myoviridae sp. ctQYc56]
MNCSFVISSILFSFLTSAVLFDLHHCVNQQYYYTPYRVKSQYFSV